VEASIAVTVISFTSFRSLFVASNATPRNTRSLRWYSFKGSKESRESREKALKGTPGQSSTAEDSTGQRSLPAVHIAPLKSEDGSALPATGFAARKWPSDEVIPRIIQGSITSQINPSSGRRLEDKSLPPTPPIPLSDDSLPRTSPLDEESLVGYPLANLAQPTQPYYQMSFENDDATGEASRPPGQFVLDLRDSTFRPISTGW